MTAPYICCDFCMTAYECRSDVWRSHAEEPALCPVCSKLMLCEPAISEAYTVVDGDQYIGAIFFGMPRNATEEDCSLESIDRVLRHSGIITLGLAQAADKRRTLLALIILADGTKLHVGAGPEGAIIYRRELP